MSREDVQGRSPTTALQQFGTVARTGNKIIGDVF